MCGIVGYSLDQGRVDLAPALTAIAHRGPDGNGVLYDEAAHVGLGHVRLAIIDLSETGAQPMASTDGRFVLVYNGEIYNFPDLRADLVKRGVTFRGHSDTEVILNLIALDGVASLDRLNGIFAFALLDRTSGELLIVRDGFGIKPLYYTSSDGRFFFASELKAFTALGLSLGAPDAEAIFGYLTYLWNPGPGTPATNFRKLGPGEAIRVKDGRILAHWIWRPQPALQPQPRSSKSVSSLAEDVRRHVREAVHRQMIADVPVGAFLSGGLDSSSIVAFARETNPNIECFSINAKSKHESSDAEDLPYAHLVAKHLNTKLHVVDVDARDMADDLEQMIFQLDEPLADPAPLNVWHISKLARAHGMKVLLSGAGGDDIFTGYRRHQALAMSGPLRALPKTVRQSLSNLGANLNQTAPSSRRVTKFLDGVALNGDDQLVRYLAWLSPAKVRDLFSIDVRARLGSIDPEEPLKAHLRNMPTDSHPIDRILALEQRFFLPEHNLTYTDKMSMAAGVEVRVPFLDAVLVDFVRTIPHTMKQHGAQGKWILKKAMEPLLPEAVIYRPKTGFGLPLRGWLRNELRAFMLDRLSEARIKRRGMFDTNSVHALIDANHTGKIDASYTLLSLLCIDIWLDRFGSQSSSAAPTQEVANPR